MVLEAFGRAERTYGAFEVPGFPFSLLIIGGFVGCHCFPSTSLSF